MKTENTAVESGGANIRPASGESVPSIHAHLISPAELAVLSSLHPDRRDLIVRAVNSHDALVAALSRMHELASAIGWNTPLFEEQYHQAVQQARAALYAAAL